MNEKYWEQNLITKTIIEKSFKHAGITNNIVSSEYYMFGNEINEDECFINFEENDSIVILT